MPGLWTAFAARNGTGDLLVASSPDGGELDRQHEAQRTQLRDAVAGGLQQRHQHQLYCAFVDATTHNEARVASSPDGVNRTPNTRTGQASERGLALAVF